jgi:hypothetical protein
MATGQGARDGVEGAGRGFCIPGDLFAVCALDDILASAEKDTAVTQKGEHDVGNC